MGDGKSIKIWNDFWLPGKENVKVSYSTDEAHGEETFDLLIDQGSRHWKGHLVDSLFTPLDAAAIKNIPLGKQQKTLYSGLLLRLGDTQAKRATIS